MSIGTILLLALFVAAHLLMHRRHGHHRGHGGPHPARARSEPEAPRDHQHPSR